MFNDWIIIEFSNKDNFNLLFDNVLHYIKNSFIYEFISEALTIPFSISN